MIAQTDVCEMAMNCTRCGKKLSRKTARVIDGKPLCSTCMFSPPPRPA
jgi:formylmethanofuran dehydrogenase subunit E